MAFIPMILVISMDTERSCIDFKIWMSGKNSQHIVDRNVYY